MLGVVLNSTPTTTQGFADSVNTYSGPNSEWAVLPENQFTGGQVLEMEIVIVYYHWVRKN